MADINCLRVLGILIITNGIGLIDIWAFYKWQDRKL